ncbi:hypothetical protein LAZ67_5001784 [Cordylochernes scorpioides]|uniref:Transposase n=1 Tax=Cordylochernes scorpioides TaxID=51811 RepID=A0ABY6KHP9_9ARAC|nr:hypothetical protein LAZ67_5001784 [Cordylochernes scorpioides]
MFSEGREDVNDEERAGRPCTSTTDEKINEVEKMILANRRITVREVAEDLNISIGSCHSIFINDLGMRRVAAKFVPKLLNCDQKQHRMNIANEMLDSVRDDPNLLQRVITGDEAWVYGYDVETKAQSSQWKPPHEPRPKKARQVRSNMNVLLTVFFDCRGVVHHEFLPEGRTVNKEYYLQVMRNLREAIRQKRPDLWMNKNWLLHHDNAPAHTSLLPPYSPDLAPCDFFLFPKLKRPMKGRRYATLDEIKTASKEELKKIFKNDFLKCFEDWKKPLTQVSFASFLLRREERLRRCIVNRDIVILEGILGFDKTVESLTGLSVYLGIMRCLREAVRLKRPERWQNNDWILHVGNARPHTAHVVLQFLAKHSTIQIPHPPYSPDLAPNDFFLYPKLKINLKGRKFDNVDMIQAESKATLRNLSKSDFISCFDNWKKRWNGARLRYGKESVQGSGKGQQGVSRARQGTARIVYRARQGTARIVYRARQGTTRSVQGQARNGEKSVQAQLRDGKESIQGSGKGQQGISRDRQGMTRRVSRVQARDNKECPGPGKGRREECPGPAKRRQGEYPGFRQGTARNVQGRLRDSKDSVRAKGQPGQGEDDAERGKGGEFSSQSFPSN